MPQVLFALLCTAPSAILKHCTAHAQEESHLFAVISLDVKEVGGEQAPVHALAVPRDATLDQGSLCSGFKDEPLHLVRQGGPQLGQRRPGVVRAYSFRRVLRSLGKIPLNEPSPRHASGS